MRETGRLFRSLCRTPTTRFLLLFPLPFLPPPPVHLHGAHHNDPRTPVAALILCAFHVFSAQCGALSPRPHRPCSAFRLVGRRWCTGAGRRRQRHGEHLHLCLTVHRRHCPGGDHYIAHRVSPLARATARAASTRTLHVGDGAVEQHEHRQVYVDQQDSGRDAGHDEKGSEDRRVVGGGHLEDVSSRLRGPPR
ncbi:hypothetical protein, unknown function [Leishmania tarentolae]|uniref:Uncharacterized protein n=1 Tax=Leishmania tarentolae TaxID=5689 RepID=A0A640K990_LEITA|nr:hypothetical protein, unknown function [Leishmania tarentolae]